MNSTKLLTDKPACEREIVQIFAEVTRYPVALLDVNADLEEDLGIDSVKLAEVFAVLRSKYQLPANDVFQIPREALSSIGGIVKFMQPYIANLPVDKVEVNVAPIVRLKQMLDNMEPDASLFSSERLPTQQATSPVLDVQKEILEVFAEVTRYPVDVLDVNAHLEDDMGIDSVKLGEIFATLRAKYNLPIAQEMILNSQALSSIAGIAEALAPYVLGSDTQPVDSENQQQEKVSATQIEGIKDAVPDEEFMKAFMRHTADILNIPVALMRPDDQLEMDLSFDEEKLTKTLKRFEEKYSLAHSVRELENAPFKTLRDIATAIAELKGSEQTHSRTVPNGDLHKHSSLSNKVCFIADAGEGLGKDIALHLASLGVTVITNSPQTSKEIDVEALGKVCHIEGSMASAEQVDIIFNELENTYGGVDFFIANTVNAVTAKLEDIDTDVWMKAFMADVICMQQASVRAMKLMRKRGGGKIITMSTPAAHNYTENYGCIAAIKAAVEAMTRYMAVEFAPYNIQVNCVSSSLVYRNVTPQPSAKEGPEKAVTAADSTDVASFISYLLSAPQSNMFAGRVTVVDSVLKL